MLLSDYDLINCFRQLFKVWFTNWTLWNWKQEIELSSPREASFQLAQTRVKVDLICAALHGWVWQVCLGFIKQSKVISGLVFLKVQPKLIRTKSKARQELWAWCTPAFLLQACCMGVYLWEWKAWKRYRQMITLNSEMCRFITCYTSSCLMCVALNKCILWVSVCSPGQFEPRRGCTLGERTQKV